MPKVITYGYYLIVKNKEIWVTSKIDGSNAPIQLNLGDFIQYWIFINGIYERNIFDLLNRQLEGKVFFDIGANIGNFTLSLYHRAKRIYAFEASLQNAKLMQRNIENNNIKNVDIINKAVSSESNKVSNLYISHHAQGNNSMYTSDESIVEKVKTITLDDFVKENKIGEVSCIKIDVEGSEMEALLGAKNILENMKPLLIVEFNSKISHLAGYTTMDLYSFIANLGYEGFRLNDKKISLEWLKDRDTNESMYFVHPKHKM